MQMTARTLRRQQTMALLSVCGCVSTWASRKFNKAQQASVYGVVKDPFKGNFDITHHYLRCIFEHLGRTKGTLGKPKNAVVLRV